MDTRLGPFYLAYGGTHDGDKVSISEPSDSESQYLGRPVWRKPSGCRHFEPLCQRAGCGRLSTHWIAIHTDVAADRKVNYYKALEVRAKGSDTPTLVKSISTNDVDQLVLGEL
ncbi:hypothetical protein LNV08_02360 [Paucibacter sp. TC2R-5]|nr:hypothetical protein [Paucibacter sp. TC2R-5]